MSQTVADPFEGLDVKKLNKKMGPLAAYAQHVMSQTDQISIVLERQIMNCEMTEHVGREEISHVLMKDEIGVSVVSTYMK